MGMLIPRLCLLRMVGLMISVEQNSHRGRYQFWQYANSKKLSQRITSTFSILYITSISLHRPFLLNVLFFKMSFHHNIHTTEITSTIGRLSTDKRKRVSAKVISVRLGRVPKAELTTLPSSKTFQRIPHGHAICEQSKGRLF